MLDQALTPDNFPNGIPTDDYENCTFTGFQLPGTQLAGSKFLECTFVDCDLSNAGLLDTAFRDVKFENCKLLGLIFADCNTMLLEMEFKDCQIDFSSFSGLKLKKTHFSNCQIQEVDFSQADLSQAVFADCNLNRSVFDQTNLEKADLRTAWPFQIDPSRNRVKKARFSKDNLSGLLFSFDIRID